MKILCLGDSNTWGYDPRGYFGGRYDHPWPQILAEKLGCEAVNLGENGRRIPARFPLPQDADLLIVLLGTNDLLQGDTPDAVCLRMEQFLGSLNGNKILLIAPPPMKPGLWTADPALIDASRALSTGYRRLAARLGISFADAGAWEVPLAYDGVHLTEEGHAFFADGVCRHIRSEDL